MKKILALRRPAFARVVLYADVLPVRFPYDLPVHPVQPGQNLRAARLILIPSTHTFSTPGVLMYPSRTVQPFLLHGPA
jgi:hypothetical protein